MHRRQLPLEFYRHLFELEERPILIATGGGDILEATESSATLLGQSRKGLLRQSVREFFPSGEESLDNREGFWNGPGGKPLKYTCNPLENDGKIKYLIYQLEEVESVSVNSFFNEKEQEKKRDEAFEERSAFLANVSHEIRTPMNGIIGMTELVMQTSLNDEQREYLNIIKISADALLHIINDILDFSKMRSGKMTLEEIPFSPSKMIEEVEHFFRPQLESKGLRFEVEAQDLPAELLGDPLRIKQIFLNIIGNAMKFTSRGFVKVTTFLEERPGKRFFLISSVADSGIGIPREKQDELFQAFSQADTSTTRKYGGTGLGLAISSSLATMMGGALTVDSYPGDGTTFTFELELKCPEQPEKSSSSSHEITEAVNEEDWKDKAILIAEDNRVNRLLACRLLETKSCRIIEAANGREAYEAFITERPDLILMDMHMPEMDGFEAFTKIRDHEGASDRRPVPIIALTAMASGDDQDSIEKHGFNAYISKPFAPEEFFHKISRLF
ncbi:MAG: ATP-binding protein [Spirochaetales bacterium]|nr:ATP-binding protein [Spirochaetales bacterium]